MSTKKQVKPGHYETEEVLHSLDETAIKSERFLEKHSKTIGIAFGVVILIAFGYFSYLKFVVEPNNKQGFNELAHPQSLFLKDSTEAALTGKKGKPGLEDVIDNYSGTNAAKVAHYYAGIANYNKGNYEQAIENFKDFSSKDDILNAVSYGAIGDCYAQLGQDDQALSQYEKAANESKNAFICFNYNKKAGMLAIQSGDNEKALKYFETIKEKFPEESEDFPELEAYIEMLKYKNGSN